MSDCLKIFPMIALSHYKEPMFRLLTIQNIDGVYSIVKEEDLSCPGDNKKTIERYKCNDLFKTRDLLIKDYLERQTKLLTAIDRVLFSKDDIISRLRSRHNIKNPPNLAYFRSLSNEDNNFFIDEYLAANPKFKRDVEEIAVNELGLNTNYREDVYLVGSFLLFGPLIVDRENPFQKFIYEKMWDLYNGVDLDSTNKVFRDFYNELKRRADGGKASEEEKFLKELQYRLDNLIEVPGEVGVCLYPKIYIIHFVDNEGVLIRRFMEIIEEISDDTFKRLITQINKKTGVRGSLDENNLNIGCFEHFFSQAEERLTERFAGKIFLQMPLEYISPTRLRNLYSTKILPFKEGQLGKRKILRIRDYSEEHLVYLILIYGIDGLPKKTVDSVLKDIGRERYDVAIRHLKRRAKNKGEIWKQRQ